jgi:nucleotide-binding universal stress UspA family protein
MDMFRHILVPLDGSPRAEQVLPVAAQVARAFQGTITLLRVVDLAHNAISYGIGAPYITQRLIEDELSVARSYLEQWRHNRALAGTIVQKRVVSGDPATAIIAQAAELSSDLVVISSHGYTGMKRWLLGSVAEKVARHSCAPVLILRDKEPLHTRRDRHDNQSVRALVPLDPSPRAQDALVSAAELVTALSISGPGELHLAQMVVVEDMASMMEREELLAAARQNLSSIEQSIREGLVARFGSELHPALSWSVSLTDDIAEGIVRIAENGEESKEFGKVAACDLIALTTHGAGGMHHWPVGSIAERVLHTTSLPMLIVRPEDMIVKERKPREHQTKAAG